MHEYSIVSALLDRVEREAVAHGASRVDRITVSLGEMSGVETELLATAFEMARQKTLCETADLEIRQVPASWVCSVCGKEMVRGALLQCDNCGAPGRLASGDEILLERIEMEVA